MKSRRGESEYFEEFRFGDLIERKRTRVHRRRSAPTSTLNGTKKNGTIPRRPASRTSLRDFSSEISTGGGEKRGTGKAQVCRGVGFEKRGEGKRVARRPGYTRTHAYKPSLCLYRVAFLMERAYRRDIGQLLPRECQIRKLGPGWPGVPTARLNGVGRAWIGESSQSR